MSDTQPTRPTGAKPGRHFISGLSSGVASAAILQPLDLLKTRMQQSGHSSLTQLLRTMRSSPAFISSLWRGTVPSVLRTGFGSALYFTTLNSIRTHVGNSGFLLHSSSSSSSSSSSVLPTLSNSANLLSGAAARTFAGLVLMPLTVIKVRFESNLYSYPSIWAAARDIRHTDGLRGFFSGFGATAMRDAPYAGSYVLFYELLKKQLSALVLLPPPPPPSSSSSSTDNNNSSSIMATSSTINFTSASLAAVACSVISNPFDAVKTRIQLQPRRYRNMAHAVGMMVREDGWRSLWDGLALRMSRKAFSSALAWTVYEELIRRASRV